MGRNQPYYDFFRYSFFRSRLKIDKNYICNYQEKSKIICSDVVFICLKFERNHF